MRVFVLSAGRTGTVFLTRTLPAHVPGVHAVHEAPGSRLTLLLGNLSIRVGRGDRLLLHRLRGQLPPPDPGVVDLQINPMLVPVTHLLPELGPLHVVHMVRHPASWVRSIRAFRASGYRRHLIDHVPFGTPFPSPLPPGWSRLDATQQALWRWRHCNERIGALAHTATSYVRIRYEDLFRGDLQRREQTLRQLLHAIQRPPPPDLRPLLTAPPANRAPAHDPVHVDPSDVDAICGDLLRAYGYVSDPATR